MRHGLHQSIPADHLLARLDARIKLLAVLTLLMMVLSCREGGFPLLVTALSLGTCFWMRIRLRLLVLRFAQPLIIAVLIILLKTFATGHHALFTWSVAGITIIGSSDGLHQGLIIAARIVGAMSLVSFLGFSTSFTALMSALAWLRVPKGLVEVALFAWRALFILFDDATVVYSAQKNRLGYSGYRRGLRSFGILIGAMIIKAFDNSQTMTAAMVQRGYDGSMPLLRQQPLKVKELIMTASFVAVMGAVWIL